MYPHPNYCVITLSTFSRFCLLDQAWHDARCTSKMDLQFPIVGDRAFRCFPPRFAAFSCFPHFFKQGKQATGSPDAIDDSVRMLCGSVSGCKRRVQRQDAESAKTAAESGCIHIERMVIFSEELINGLCRWEIHTNGLGSDACLLHLTRRLSNDR